MPAKSFVWVLHSEQQSEVGMPGGSGEGATLSQSMRQTRL